MGGYEANSVYGLCMGMYLEKGSVIALRVPVPHAATGWGVPLSTPPSSVRKAGPKRPVMPAACAPSELSKRRTLLIGATCRETAEI